MSKLKMVRKVSYFGKEVKVIYEIDDNALIVLEGERIEVPKSQLKKIIKPGEKYAKQQAFRDRRNPKFRVPDGVMVEDGAFEKIRGPNSYKIVDGKAILL